MTARLPSAAFTQVESRDLIAVRVPADDEQVPLMRKRLVAFAASHGASPAAQANVALAIAEAMSNAVLHRSARDEQWIEVVADMEDGALEAVVADNGPGLRGHVTSEGLGLGLSLIVQSSDQCTVRDREPHGTEVWMRFELP
jgi:anti-sigma regulatory factor (Ser/Thr protein kinase)